MKTQFAMKYVVLFIALLWAFVGRSQGTIESCRAMGLYFCTECEDSSFQCELCASGYTLTSNKTGCLKCATNCAKCTPDQVADEKCTECVTGYAVDSSTDKCVSCSAVDNCEKCNVASNTASCTECKTGFSLYDNTCHNCSSVYSNCLTCSSTDGQTFTCDSCYPGYNRTNEECIACPDNCLECENFNSSWICSDDKCATGYQKLSSDNLCHACPNNCAKCTESNTTPDLLVCDTCLSQFTLNTTCEACPANCAKCSTSTVCDTCKDGYYLDSDNVCQTCPTNCAKCSASTVCETCKDSYYLDSDNVCQSTATFGTGCVGASFKSLSCSVCQEGVGATLVSDKCLINCYTCGNLTNNEPTSNATECNSQGNEYQDKVPCEYGCYIAIKYSDSQMIFASRGCVVNATCLSDDVEQCSNTGPSQNCFKCCDSGELCNGDYWDLSSAAVSHVIGIITTSVTILAAYVIN